MAGGGEKGTAQAAITGLAILKVNWERLGRDYLESFVPLVVECVRELKSDEVSLPILQQAIQSRFGLSLPQNPIKAILQRAARDGFLRRDHGVFVRVVEKCGSLDFEATERRVARLHDEVVTSLTSYARESQGLEWSAEQAEEALLGLLATDDSAILFAALDGAPFAFHADKSQAARYVVSAFVQEVALNKPELLDAIETLAKGSMLANSLFLPSLGSINKRFRDTKVFLDTSVVIYYLGYGGDDRQAPFIELIQLLRQYGATLRVLPDTIEEVRRILNACAARIRNHRLQDAYGPTIDYFLAKKYTSGDIELLIGRFPEKLRAQEILEEEPPPLTAEYPAETSTDREVPLIGEYQLEQALQHSVGYVKREALIHDVTSISAILRLRRGRPVHEIESCRALFLTTNAALARGAKEFCRSDGFAGEVPPCITDFALGNLLWLKSPTDAPNLPRKLLIADAFAATQPSDELWKHYLAEIAKLRDGGGVTEADYYVLRHSSSARAAVMQMTKGEEEAFSDGTIEEVLSIARETIRADLKKAIQDKDVALAELQRKQEAEAQESARLLAGERERATALHESLARKALSEESRLVRAKRRAQGVARVLLFVPRVLVIGGFVLATILTFPWSLPAVQTAMPQYVRSGLLVALFCFSVYASFFGTPIKAMLARWEDSIAAHILRWLEE